MKTHETYEVTWHAEHGIKADGWVGYWDTTILCEPLGTEAEAKAFLEANPNTKIMRDIRVRKELKLVLIQPVQHDLRQGWNPLDVARMCADALGRPSLPVPQRGTTYARR